MANSEGYSIYLMIELAKFHGVISKELEYDLAWDKGIELSNDFRGSKFNDSNKSEYECIEEFLTTPYTTFKVN